MESGNPFRLIDLLRKHEVPFVVIGGHAVTYHGYARATEDVDIVFLRTDASERSVLGALSEANAKWIGAEIDPTTKLERLYNVTAEYVQRTHLMMLVTDFGYLDVFDFIPGMPSEQVSDLIDTSIDTGRGNFASLQWLRRMKEASGRPQDLSDLANLPNSE